MKEKLGNLFKRFGHVIVDPVLYLAVIGIVLAISSLCSLGSGFIYHIYELLNAAANSAVLGNLPVILCVGLTAGFAKKQKANAAVLGLISYLMYVYINNAYLTMTNQLAVDGSAGMALYGTGQQYVFGVQCTDINVFGGILIGCLAGYVWNKFLDVKVPEFLRVYGGPRLVLLVMIPVMIVFSILAAIVWPVVAKAIEAISGVISSTGALGVFIYGAFNRGLIPTGLHHFFWMPFCFTPLGGTATIGGETYYGATNIFYGEMPLIANGTLTQLDTSLRYGHFGFAKEFIALGMALSMIHCARPENKKAVTAMIIPIYITASLAGITEAMDFTVVFSSVWLWVFKAVLVGLSEAILFLLGNQTYNIFGWFELITVNFLSGLPASVTGVWVYLGLGVAFVVLTYFSSNWFIKKFNVNTPGRAADWGEEASANADVEYTADMGKTYVEAMGGKENIVSCGCCITRLRTEVRDMSKVNEELLKTIPNTGIVKQGKELQLVIGMKVHDLFDQVKPILKIED
ncbi:MAG: PTS transporter subunit EIIC [Erysipelotrichaceae bacterium]|nr:PTS transporter subunit EIIC [Erysipelotrichaceae bacterium]